MAIVTVLTVTVPAVSTTDAAAAAPKPNAVITWNNHADEAINGVAELSPTAGARAFAIVQGAVYDAVNAIAGTPYEPYLIAPLSRPGDSRQAAVAAAAYRTLRWLFPDQADSLRELYDESLAAIPDGRAKRGGIAVGQAAAAAMIDARRDDGAGSDATWPVGTAPGKYRLTPPDFLQVGAWYATLKPFIVDDIVDYDTPGPPALTSAEYARNLNEVKALGSATSTKRTRDQTEAAIWWDDARGGEWPIKRQLAATHRLSILESARMFAMVDVTTADAMIACYKEKKFWHFWRPVTAIPLAGIDRNPATKADPDWTPLLTTAPSPEYPSGHACFTASTMFAFRTYFGRDDVSFSAFSADSGTTRRYRSFSQANAELIEARIWGGVHYRFATEDGDRLGESVARDALKQAFRPRGD
ncbi:vanadium-dependent haloperoxidase [Nonomuraea typhae]|uniref:Vanadium-dependent haloperoxidase n=1 Tax=Nonomuraea typhae TaxID=2603600 RepID=A0ABW7Z6Q9_9ACTN